MKLETKARLKIMTLVAVSAGVWVYWLKNPYLAFLFGAITMKISGFIWENAISQSDDYIKVTWLKKGMPCHGFHRGVEIIEPDEGQKEE